MAALRKHSSADLLQSPFKLGGVKGSGGCVIGCLQGTVGNIPTANCTDGVVIFCGVDGFITNAFLEILR